MQHILLCSKQQHMDTAHHPALTTSRPPEGKRARGTLISPTLEAESLSARKQVEGEARAAEERPVLGESREFSAVWVLARLEVDLVRCSLGPQDVM
ncbi:hypothetical protein E2C01_001514 [Portunus trituberculatus]|uniref:Uncharacterized protein n=1 Tax=Portunus trituberculatus TaxID=210409 RepID=A0A5B7CI54_PORTR|nr:hypothetical protein [Portunus trituberculatus]